jgi:hypothetical protein
MKNPITYYIVNGNKLNYTEFEKLAVKPKMPIINNFGGLKNFVAENTSLSEIIVDTDKNRVYLQ